jgi:Tfp pilus assembly protein PilF
MRLSLLLFVSALAWAQTPDTAYEPLRNAYRALQNKQYDQAIESFQQAIQAAPGRPAVRKDLAYTYLKVGETEAARDQFAEAMRLDTADFHVALEYAFLCNENKMQAEARRVFDRVRKTGDAVSRATAEQAFENIDQPLAAGIERWKKALELAPESFTAHYELATLSEQRDELALAAEHYRSAWRILPSRKQTLLELGRVLMAMARPEDADAALLAASRGGEPRAREQARELLPPHYPYVGEFRHALELDPANVELRRDLAFLLMTMQREPEAEHEFHTILDQAPDDLLSCAQLGFLYLNRDDKAHAMPLLERVLKGSDIPLANRVRATLKMPLLHDAEQSGVVSDDAKVMAERSLKSGYLKDALIYLQQAHAANPDDGWVMLKLGWTYNILHADNQAYHWFSLARNSSDPSIAGEARKAYDNLHPELARFRTTVWIYPFFSTRWHDTFGYGQVKTELKLDGLPFRPYLSMRLFGDTRGTTGGPLPQYLSDSSVVIAGGVASSYWHGVTGWFEAGSAIRYWNATPSAGRTTTPDYRGGASFGKGFGHLLGGTAPGWFFESNLDGIYVSRYENDFLLYAQTRIGVTLPVPEALGGIQTQLFWNDNIIRDAKSLDWANYVETGPGLKFRWPWMPRSLSFTISALRGAYTVTQYYRRPNFNDVRMGFWYAITR